MLGIVCFFFAIISSLVKEYSNLFNQETEEGDEEGEGYGEKDDDGESNTEFGTKWGFINMVDTVSNTVQESWDKVFEMKIREFLNILCYSRDKAEYERKKIEEYKRKH